MTGSGISVPTSASVPWTICGPTTLFGRRSGRLPAREHPLAPQATASVTVQPLEIISFDTIPGPGSEWASFGLARYPAEIEVTYSPRGDDRFIKTVTKGGWTRWEFDWKRGSGGWSATATTAGSSPMTRSSRRNGRSRPGWRLAYSTFCKTQYASDPTCGGVPNFVRCHLCVIHLLDRIAELPTMKVRDRRRGQVRPVLLHAMTRGRKKRVYTWHDGKYDVKALVQEVGEWNEMIATMFGAMKDAAQGERSSWRGITDRRVPRRSSSWSSRGRTTSTLSRS